MAQLDLAPIKARLSAATPGPWYWDETDHHLFSDDYNHEAHDSISVRYKSRSLLHMVEDCAEPVHEADAVFMAHARQDIERLVALVETLLGAPA